MIGVRPGIKCGIRPGLAAGLSADEIGSGATDPQLAPATAAAFTALGLTAPDGIYTCQQASGSLLDSVAANHMANIGSTPLYRQSVPGWARKAVFCADGTLQFFEAVNGTLPNISTTSLLALAYVRLTATPSGEGAILTLGAGSNHTADARATVTPRFKSGSDLNVAVATGTVNPGTVVHPIVLKVDHTGSAQVVYTDKEKITPAFQGTMTNAGLAIGCNPSNTVSAPVQILYVATWFAANAEMADATVKSMLTALGWIVTGY